MFQRLIDDFKESTGTALRLTSLAAAAAMALLVTTAFLCAAAFVFVLEQYGPVQACLTGAAIGLLQDALTAQPIGVNGMAKSVIGYIAASIGIQVDVENLTTRILINFGFFVLNSFLVFLINRRLLGLTSFHILWLHELLRAAVNTAVALPIFFLLDNTKRRD